MADLLKLAEQRGYSKGYNAGRRRAKALQVDQRNQRERQAFLDKAFLAVLPALINATDWKVRDVPCSTVEQRIELAWIVAKVALRTRKFA